MFQHGQSVYATSRRQGELRGVHGPPRSGCQSRRRSRTQLTDPRSERTGRDDPSRRPVHQVCVWETDMLRYIYLMWKTKDGSFI